jgi:ribosomal protein S18 acetylase RimI-like enzyme
VDVRPARPEDAAAIAAVHVRTWQAAYDHVFGAERLAVLDEQLPRRIERWEQLLREEGGVWVAEADGRVVGFVGYGVSRDEAGPAEGELYSIYVLPEAWGSGAGPALMAVAREALLAAYPVAILWVLDDNPRARRFYEREGWAADGGRKTDTFLGVEVTEVRYRLV